MDRLSRRIKILTDLYVKWAPFTRTSVTGRDSSRNNNHSPWIFIHPNEPSSPSNILALRKVFATVCKKNLLAILIARGKFLQAL